MSNSLFIYCLYLEIWCVVRRLCRLTTPYSLRLVIFNLTFGISSIVLIFYSVAAWAETGQVTGLPLPRFISLKFSETNIRKGPDIKHPIVWNYKQKGYPMEVITEFENWRKLRDVDGAEGWIHENRITGIRSVVIIGNKYLSPRPEYEQRSRELILFRYPDENSYPMLRAEFGVVGKIMSCNLEWCKLQVDHTKVWARKENLWGVYLKELLN